MTNIVKKLLTPLRIGREYVFPQSVASQIMMDDDLSKDASQVMVRKDKDILTLEEIEASTSLEGKVASAEAVKRLNSELKWRHHTSLVLASSENIHIDIPLDANEVLVEYGRKNGDQSYGGGTIIFPMDITTFSKPCILPIYDWYDDISAIVYIYSSYKHLEAERKQGNEELLIKVWYR